MRMVVIKASQNFGMEYVLTAATLMKTELENESRILKCKITQNSRSNLNAKR